jgi:hypothetical protein
MRLLAKRADSEDVPAVRGDINSLGTGKNDLSANSRRVQIAVGFDANRAVSGSTILANAKAGVPVGQGSR